jgi:flavodoxin
MSVVVVYESVYGNTRAVAEAIADGLGGAELVPAHEAATRAQGAELLVVGGPTHMHGMTTTRSRLLAVEAVHKEGDSHYVEPDAAEEPGLRDWIHDLPNGSGAHAAAFDTRADKPPWLTGAASCGIAKRLRRRGYEILSTESFLVEDSEGPLVEGELERARAWGAELATSLPGVASGAAS